MPPDNQNATILLVENDLDIRELAKRYLKMAGFTVTTASDGEEGFRLFQEHQPSIRLLLTDVAMPRLSGPDLADRVLGIDPELPVLFMSGAPWNSHRGLNCLMKPFWPVSW